MKVLGRVLMMMCGLWITVEICTCQFIVMLQLMSFSCYCLIRFMWDVLI